MRTWGLIPILLVLSLLIVPVAGQSVTESAPEGEGITSILIKSDVGTSGSITFHFNNGSDMTSSWSYVVTSSVFDFTGGLIQNKRGTITVGSETNYNNYITPGSLYTYYVLPGHDFSYYNVSSNNVVGQIGQWEGAYDTLARSPAPYSSVNSFSLSSDQDVTIEFETAEIGNINYNQGLSIVDESKTGEWGYQIAKVMELGVKYLTQGLSFIQNLFYWLKFFFVDNLMLVITLYISVSMVLAARAARGRPDKFLSRFLNQQVKLFEFIISLWRMLIESIGTIRGWFRI